jgi:hypothetical protein
MADSPTSRSASCVAKTSTDLAVFGQIGTDLATPLSYGGRNCHGMVQVAINHHRPELSLSLSLSHLPKTGRILAVDFNGDSVDSGSGIG